jgi:SAM-dependent methyltransferase
MNRYLEETYLDANPAWHVEDSAWKATQIMRAIKELPNVPQTISEVGCGAGEILSQLHLSLPSAHMEGSDISPHAIEIARTRETQNVNFNIRSIPLERFDLILAIDVIEHIEDCFTFLRLLRAHASTFIFHIPLELNCEFLLRNALIQNRSAYGHLHHFTRETAFEHLRDCGYEIKRWFYTPGYRLAPKPQWYHPLTFAMREMIYKFPKSELLIGGRSVMVTAVGVPQ